MIELIFTFIALAAIVAIAWAKDTARKSYDVMVPRDIQKGAQHAANTSRKSQVVVYAMGVFEIMRADNQHAARGDIVMVFHPKDEYVQARKQIFIGGCISPKTHMLGENHGSL